jgi:hypothetical protein
LAIGTAPHERGSWPLGCLSQAPKAATAPQDHHDPDQM